MKRLLSLMLAAAMVLSIGAMTVSAADPTYKVAFVWNTGFVKDEDGVLDIGDGGSGYSSDTVPYGSTVYFPLINTNYGDHNKLVELENAKKARDKAKADLDAAKAPLQAAIDSAEATKNTAEETKNNAETAKAAAETTKATAETAKTTAETKKSEAETALNNITTNATTIGNIFDDMITLVNTLPANFEIVKSGHDSSAASLAEEIAALKNHLTNANKYISDTAPEGYVSVLTSYYNEQSVANAAAVDLIVSFVTTAKAALNNDAEIDDIVRPTDFSTTSLDNAKSSFLASLTKVSEKLTAKIGDESDDTATEPASEGIDLHQWVLYHKAESKKIKDVLDDIDAKCASLETYDIEISSADRTNSTRLGELKTLNTSTAAAQTAYDNAVSELATATTNLENAVSDLETKTNTYNTALSAFNDAESAYNTAVSNLTNDTNVQAKQKAFDDAKKAVEDAEAALNGATNAFVFITESAAVSNAKVKAEWDYGSKYVDKIELDKVKAVSSTGDFGLSSSSKSIYCIAVTLKDSSSTNEVEVEGEIAISKSGSNGYSLADTAANIYLTVGATVADPDSEITATPQLFEEDYSFDAEEDHIFYFEEDSTSWFEVNTKSQKDIVLAFDIDWDDDIADEIFEKNPNADLDFYNGNYAKFSRTGTLWLGYPEDDAEDAYVYAISSSGKLSLVNAEYDEYEEAFEIRTNTLGRYVIATEKLKSVGTSSGSSGSGTGTGTGTGTVTTSSKSSAATPVSSSKPASSTPVSSSKPASSTPASSQVSSQESSKESKPSSSEPLSIKEPSSEEDNKYVSGTTDPKDEDVPTKKGGVSWIVWLLILAGLVAVVIAVGVIFYTKKNSGRRML